MWNTSWVLFLRWRVTIQRNVGLILGHLGLSCYYPKGYSCLPMLMGYLGGNVLELFTVILASLRSAHDLTKMSPPLFSCSHSLSSFLTGAYCNSLLPALALAPLSSKSPTTLPSEHPMNYLRFPKHIFFHRPVICTYSVSPGETLYVQIFENYRRHTISTNLISYTLSLSITSKSPF